MSDQLFVKARERAIAEGSRIFQQTIDAATNSTVEDRRQAIDAMVDRLVNRAGVESLSRKGA